MVKSYQPEVIGQEERGRGPSLVQKNTDKTANDTGGMVVVNRGKVQNCGSATVSGEDGSNPRGPGEHATPSKQSMDVITIGNVADIVTEDPIVRKQLGRWDFVKHAPTILIAISMALVGGEGASFKNIMTRVHRCEGAAVRGVATYRLRIEEKETSFALNQFQFADVAWASNQYDDTRPRYRLWHDATKAKTAGWAQCSGCDVTIDGIEIKAIRRSRWVKKVLK